MPYARQISLNDIYKASQCTDVRDCILSIRDLKKRMHQSYLDGYSPDRRSYLRLNSLYKKLNYFRSLNKKKYAKL